MNNNEKITQRELKSVGFRSHESLTEYINQLEIPPDAIQQIVYNHRYVLFYWE